MSTPPASDTAKSNAQLWGSDAIAAMLRALDIEYIALTPGASFRGLHDSLVNYLGNMRPEHAAVPARGARGRARPWLCARHRPAAGGRAALRTSG